MRKTVVTCDRCGAELMPAVTSLTLHEEDEEGGRTQIGTIDVCAIHLEEIRGQFVPMGVRAVTVRESREEQKERTFPPAKPLPMPEIPVAPIAPVNGQLGRPATVAERARHRGKTKRQKTMDLVKWAPREALMLQLLQEAQGEPVRHRDLAVLMDMDPCMAGEVVRRLWRQGKVLKVSGGPSTKWILAGVSGVKGAAQG